MTTDEIKAKLKPCVKCGRQPILFGKEVVWCDCVELCTFIECHDPAQLIDLWNYPAQLIDLWNYANRKDEQ